VVVPGLVLLGLWWAYVAWRIPPSAADAEAAGAVGPPLAGWAPRATLLGWTGLLLGLYGLFLSGELLGRFLSSMRALAPTVLAAVLAIVAFQGTPREPPGSVKAGLPSCRDDDPYR
jgi:hypothetical protein